MKLDIQWVALTSSLPVTCEMPANICQIRLPMMNWTCSVSTSWWFLWTLEKWAFRQEGLEPHMQSAIYLSQELTCAEELGLRNTWNGLSITGSLWTSRMNPYSAFLALMGWNGVGGSQNSTWTGL